MIDLKVGDMVRVHKENSQFGMGFINLGDIGTIIEIDRHYRIKFHNHEFKWTVDRDGIELVTVCDTVCGVIIIPTEQIESEVANGRRTATQANV